MWLSDCDLARRTPDLRPPPSDSRPRPSASRLSRLADDA